ncbi:ABC transporter substrate-binding protein [Enterococcus mundtii]|uniref:extracellular solute-binding protein n=1 Tax=Enterococcus mundtii TaxID=53346 RepID=UPI0007EED9D6|nr:extracellular solute-binding protein [Enterococcus mundtii]OBS62644.1 ABC transporter substrate-binding protein [Enterococcus mundtii]
MKKLVKKGFIYLSFVSALGILGACSTSNASENANGNEEKVIIYTNADEEPVQIIKDVLDSNGFENQYLLQSFGTSELSGKLWAEGTDIEADLVTMSTFYLDGVQENEQVFKELALEVQPIDDLPNYQAPMTTQEGVIFYNTQAMEEADLPVPTSLADLADPIYEGQLAISDINHSSTAWLLFQGLIDQYGETEAQTILADIYDNAGDHIEASGSGPLKKVRVGEVALGFGLRHQAIKDKKEGLPIDFVEPSEGTYALTESLAVIDKGEDTNPLAEEMLNVILKEGRADLLQFYPSKLYETDDLAGVETAKNQKVFPEALTPDLLKKHASLVE